MSQITSSQSKDLDQNSLSTAENMNKFWILLLTFTSSISICVGIDPISAAIGVAAIGGTGLMYTKDYLCSMNKWLCVAESCADYYIPADFKGLKEDLNRNLFGQHIVIEMVTKALNVHYEHLKNSKKPLVMSFHGTAGTGKNYVAEHIAKRLYRHGMGSKYVHKYSGRLDFTEKSKTEEYSTRLKNEIIQAISTCPRSLFIFDEVDSMPAGIFDTITSLLDHHEPSNGKDFRQAVFIFLTNIGGVEIGEKLLELYRVNGFTRETASLKSFEKILETCVYNREGGLQGSKTIEASLIDHFIPFLPLEKRHIERCIEVEFARVGLAATEDMIVEMLGHVTFLKNKFSKNGCKRLTKKADMYVEPKEHNRHSDL